jgi:radical SAM-linked protein
MARYINPLEDLGGLLMTVEKPARYTGGEYGMLAKRGAALQTVIAFPDMYELGMSNQALRILYNRLNALHDVSCDRVFAPAPDFEKLLKEKKIPLYALDTGIALRDTNILMFTLGYELCINSALTILDTAGIPLHKQERGEEHPILIAGGPCVSNPLPYARFIDAFWIGEAEDEFFTLIEQLRSDKKNGAKKAEMFDRLAAHDSIWVQGKEKAVRAIYAGFSKNKTPSPAFPVPNMRITQHHGVVEIMRGCPNGCRFCHAGVWYRPMRQKDARDVFDEAAECIAKTGFREISLSSLSSGDYRYIENLIDALNKKFSGNRVSFQLPSLHVSTFSLPVLEKLSTVRKSGLTFAVETPMNNWQAAVNKVINMDSIAGVMAAAKKNGWRSAKLYFMIGLPVNGTDTAENPCEDEAIIAFVAELSARTHLKFSINVGVFVPKPHTPFQWSAQIEEDKARLMLRRIRDALKKQGHKVSVHDPFTALVEGLIARGDEDAGRIIEQAYNLGCRLDAWSEHFQEEIWRGIFREHHEYIERITGARNIGERLDWDIISSNVSKKYIAQEMEKAEKYRTDDVSCMQNCTEPCGVCGNDLHVVENNIQLGCDTSDACPSSPQPVSADNHSHQKDPDTYRILFSFLKEGRAVFLPHLALIEIFSMAFMRAGIPVLYTSGFNPLPRLDFAAPLSLGIRSAGEIASVDTNGLFSGKDFIKMMNTALPEGLVISGAYNFLIPSGVKKHSVAAMLWGFEYVYADSGPDYVEARDEKEYRRLKTGGESAADKSAVQRLYGLSRLRSLAKRGDAGASYFDVYRELYP